MFRRIAVPVDLAHPEKLDKALATAVELAQLYAAELLMVAVTSSAPSAVARNPDEFRDKLEAFAQRRSEGRSVAFVPQMLVAKDPSAELDHLLDKHFHNKGVDLVVMASHVPGFRDYVFSSRAGFLASHTDLSVLVVR